MKKEIVQILSDNESKVDTSKEEVITESQFESIATELIDELHLFSHGCCNDCISFEEVHYDKKEKVENYCGELCWKLDLLFRDFNKNRNFCSEFENKK